MKNLKLMISAIAIALLMIPSKSMAQDYTTGLGVTLGHPLGLDIKHFLSSKAAISGTLATDIDDYVLINGTYQLHAPICENLNFYYGIGASIGSGSSFILGITPNIGTEYKIPTLPLALALDYRPMFSLTTASAGYGNVGFKILYTF